MPNLPEGLIYVLALAVAYLAHHLLKRFGPQLEPQPPQAEPDEEQMAQEPVPAGLAAASIDAAPPQPGPKAVVVRPTLPNHPRGQPARRALTGSNRSKQAAIAMATILGPCRALEPDGNQASSGR